MKHQLQEYIVDDKDAIFIPDNKIGGYTAFFEKFPSVISEGDTIEEAIINLQSAFEIMKEDLKL